MTRGRDRAIAIGAVVVLAALAAAVVALVLNAQSSGIETREDFRLEQARSEANQMESRVQSAYQSLLAVYGAPATFTMEPGNEADAARIAPQSPDARSGGVLVDADGTIVNGALLRDESLIGQPYDRPGIEVALEDGEPTMLPVDTGLTTTRPTLAVAIPTRDMGGSLSGAYVLEVEIAADSAFNEEIAELRTGDTGGFSFVDGTGLVVASNDERLLAQPLEEEVVSGFRDGFHRADGRVAAIATVPSAGWKAIFAQDVDEFEGDITGPLQLALLLFLGAVGIAGTVAVVALLRRLSAAREEERRLREISEAREEFTSIVSHELRTPVAGLLGFLQTTMDHWEAMGEAERRRAVGRAFTNARSLQTLTTDVLDSASIEASTMSYRFEPIDVRTCVVDAVEQLADATPERTVNVQQPSEPVIVNGDAIRLRQVLTNLLDNAAKSSAPDSPIDIDVATDGRTASVTVRDRGAGIDAEDRERIFEKFTRGRVGIGRGSGLGLYISRHIVEAHGGTISASSVTGEPGARFTFTVPLQG
jgi:signal transduction histidine kinase